MLNVGVSRLVALNKVWPQIPSRDDFRPITVLSAMYKFMELRFLPKLNNYLVNHMLKF